MHGSEWEGRSVTTFSTPNITQNLEEPLLANDIIMYETRIFSKEQELREILDLEQFKLYRQVFNQFCFGTITQSLLILHCYPIERFLVNGKPYFRGDHDISLRKFQAYLGLGYCYQISGDTSAKQDKVKKSWKGSDLIRSFICSCNGDYLPE